MTTKLEYFERGNIVQVNTTAPLLYVVVQCFLQAVLKLPESPRLKCVTDLK